MNSKVHYRLPANHPLRELWDHCLEAAQEMNLEAPEMFADDMISYARGTLINETDDYYEE